MMLLDRLAGLTKKKFIRDVSYVYVSSMVNGASLFLINVLLGRNLSKEWFATFSLSLLVLSTVAEVSDLGLNAGLARFAPYYIAHQQFDKLKQLVKTIWQWRVSLTVVLTVTGLLLATPIATHLFGQPSLAPYLLFSFLGVGGVVLLGFINTFLQASQRFFYNAGLQTLKGLLRLIAVVTLILLGTSDLYWYLSIYILVPWILFAVSFRVLPKGFTKVSVDEETKQKMHDQLKRFSAWLSLWSLFSILASRIDQVVISHYLGLEQVAIYAAAYQLIQLYPLVTQSIAAVLSPKISGLHSKAALIHFLKRSLKWISIPVVVLSTLVYPSQYIITLFFGSSFSGALPVYLVLAYSLVFNLFAIPFSLIITAYNRTELMAISGVIQVAVNIVGTIILVPRFGVLGAGYTFGLGIMSAVLYNIACSVYLLKNKEIVVN